MTVWFVDLGVVQLVKEIIFSSIGDFVTLLSIVIVSMAHRGEK